MKICHIITRMIVGGAQENTLLTCRGLHERGHEVILLSGPETGPEGSLWEQAQAVGFRTVILGSLRRAVRPLRDWRARSDIRRLLKGINPDVVHTHSSKAGILGRDAAHGAGVPLVLHTIHGMSFNRTQSPLVQRFYRMLEKRAARKTDVFICVADAMRQQAVAAGLGPAEKFITVRSGIETERYMPSEETRRHVRASWGLVEEATVIGTVARLFDNKGYEELIEAMPSIVARHPAARFVWVGDGRNRPVYERRLADLGLRDRVRILGLVRPEEIPGLIAGFDLLVHASRWEGLPRAVVQALLLEVPAVAFDIDGAPEVIREGETGWVVPLGDVSALADAVVRLADNPQRRREFGRRGRSLCLHEFDWRRMVEQLEKAYSRSQGGGAPMSEIGSNSTLRTEKISPSHQ
ncbi:MAG: glycosyltransferase family 4 protein [Phycisphaerae bacterium]|nr:glycosyltransferase family 4 protein [Phycisphaerae bacterium]